MDELDTPCGESCSYVAESSGGTADEQVVINAVAKGFWFGYQPEGAWLVKQIMITTMF